MKRGAAHRLAYLLNARFTRMCPKFRAYLVVFIAIRQQLKFGHPSAGCSAAPAELQSVRALTCCAHTQRNGMASPELL